MKINDNIYCHDNIISSTIEAINYSLLITDKQLNKDSSLNALDNSSCFDFDKNFF